MAYSALEGLLLVGLKGYYTLLHLEGLWTVWCDDLLKRFRIEKEDIFLRDEPKVDPALEEILLVL